MLFTEEYSTDDLTKKQYMFVLGIEAALETVDDEICDYCIGADDEDTTVLDKMRCEIAKEVLAELKDRIESNMSDCIVGMVDENACKVIDMPRKKAEKKFGKKFVSEVLDD